MKHKNWYRKAKKGKPARAYLWNETFRDGVLVMWGATTKSRLATMDYHCYGLSKKQKGFIGRLSDASYTNIAKNSFIAFRDKKPTAGIIAHESLHFINHLMERRGVPLAAKHDETHAYLLWWLVDNIMELTRHGKFDSRD